MPTREMRLVKYHRINIILTYPIFEMINKRLLSRLQEKKARLEALRPLPAAAVQRLNEYLAIEWTYHSNAIEGNSLTLRETQLILEQGITIGGKSLREHFEVINHREAITMVESLAKKDEPVTPATVRQLHALVMARIDDENAGHYRQLPVRIAGSAHEPPPAWEVPARMSDWADWLADEENRLEPVNLAGIAHHRLVSIHPFLDGNGRTARLVMNLVLLRAGYPPAIIARANRTQYYRSLALADRGKDTPLANLVARAVERSLTLYLEAVIPQREPPKADDEWLALREAAEGSSYSQEYLSFLARTGQIEAIKRGRNWYTSLRAIKYYQTSIHSIDNDSFPQG
jgi:Fic family protein